MVSEEYCRRASYERNAKRTGELHATLLQNCESTVENINKTLVDLLKSKKSTFEVSFKFRFSVYPIPFLASPRSTESQDQWAYSMVEKGPQIPEWIFLRPWICSLDVVSASSSITISCTGS